MKKITTFLALLLTCIIGATAADFVPKAGAKYLIKCKGDNKYVLWNSSCVLSGTDSKVILSNWAQYDYRSFFSIEGDATNGYTIRSVKDNTQYVYAINTNDADSNVGVKAVTGTPGDECVWKIVAQGDGWNIIPKNGEYSWNNRGIYNGNAHVGMWSSNSNANDIWYIQTVEDLANAMSVGTSIGSINADGKTTVLAKAKAFNEGEGTEAQFNEFVAANSAAASYINLPTGYYRIKSCANDGNGSNFSVFDGTYLFTDIVNYPNAARTLANVPLDEAKAKNNYVWKITRGELPSATVGIVNGQGKGVNNGTNYNTINLGLSDYYTTGAIYFTQGLHITNQRSNTVGNKQNASAEATRSNPFTMTGWAHSDSKGSAYIFEPVSMDGVTAYTVNVTGAEGYVTLNSTNEVAMNGGFFLLSSAPQVADFTAATVANYDAAVSIEGNTINVNYTYKLEYIKPLAEAALAKTGVGYPKADAATRTALAEVVKGTDATAIGNALKAFQTSTEDIQLPEDGKAYYIKVPYINGTANYLYSDGNNETSNRVGNKADDQITDKNDKVFVCHIVNGKYMFATNHGTYLSWADSGDGTKSYKTSAQTTTYVAQNDWTIEPATLDKGAGKVSLTNRADVFGYVQMKGLGKNGTTTYYLNSRINDAFVAQNSADKFYDANNGVNRSCYYQFEEVEYPNTITFHDATGINGVSHIATFSAPFATIIPAGVKAYYVSAKGAEATMTAIDAEAIPANQGVILTSESGAAATMVPAAGETAATITGNQLGHSAGAARALTAGEGYILGNGTEGTAFYPCKAGSLPINKAYLLGNGENAIVMNFGNAVTGINTIAAPASAKAPIFDLSGRRVVKATKGLYIQNGKKVIVK